jgi:hypothetical protein
MALDGEFIDGAFVYHWELEIKRRWQSADFPTRVLAVAAGRAGSRAGRDAILAILEALDMGPELLAARHPEPPLYFEVGLRPRDAHGRLMKRDHTGALVVVAD